MSHEPEISDTHHATPATNAAGRWYLIFLGLFVALIGALFFWLMSRSYLRAREMRNWPEVECVILSSELEEWRHDKNSAMQFRQNLSFGYVWKGQAHTGDHLTLRGSPWSSYRALVQSRVLEYPVGKTTTCRVNPAAPEFAVLKPDLLAPGYSIWFPGLFIIGGLGITLRAVLSPKRQPR